MLEIRHCFRQLLADTAENLRGAEVVELEIGGSSIDHLAFALGDGTTKTTSLPSDGVIGHLHAKLAEFAIVANSSHSLDESWSPTNAIRSLAQRPTMALSGE